MSTPLVSVVLPFHNNRDTLALAVRSILLQSFADWELIWVNDACTDGAAEVLRQFTDARIKLLTNPTNLGLAASLNHGIAAARGQFIARMDADDISYPQRLERQLHFLQAHPEVDLVGTAMLAFVGAQARALLRAALSDDAIKRGERNGAYALYHPTWMARAPWFRAHPYDLQFRKAQDYELLSRAAPHSRYANLPDVLVGYRLDAASLRKRNNTRGYVLRAQVKNLLRQGRWWAFAWAATITVAKLLADALFFRGAPVLREDVPAALRDEWTAVFGAVASESERCNLPR